MTQATVLIVGSGGREHTLSLAYEKSSKVGRIIISPGNEGMLQNRTKLVEIDKHASLKSAESILEVAKRYNPDLIDVAQDDALAAGTVDLLRQHGFTVFGSTQKASRIEWDKSWAREFCQTYGIRGPKYKIFNNQDDGIKYIEEIYQVDPNSLLFIKASGLAGGKGALKAESLEEAKANILKMSDFGSSGSTFLVEEGLVGEEFSVYALTDGEDYVIFKSAQDHKLLSDNDKGPQTGGMGSYSPASITKGLMKSIEEDFIQPVIRGMQKEKHPFQGIIYFSGMYTKKGVYTIEYNARWGDPEAQVVIPSIQSDYYDLIQSCIAKKLGQFRIKMDDLYRICIVGASKGYPNDYRDVKGREIHGLDNLTNDITVLSAGMSVVDGKYIANGGRLFNIVASGDTLTDAKLIAYQAMNKITIEGNNLHYRTDIGRRDLEREKPSKVIIVDFGGQYSHLIGRRIRDFGIYSEIIPYNQEFDGELEEAVGIILSGGPQSVGLDQSPKLPEKVRSILDSKSKPVLGICYGHQLLGHYFGGEVKHSQAREYGSTIIHNMRNGKLLDDVENFTAWMSHGDHVAKVGNGFIATASSENCPVVAMEAENGKIYGVQFHPEVTHTEFGSNMLKRFVHDICGVTGSSWSMEAYKESLISQIQDEVQTEKVLLGVSGGVDSLVASLVLHEAIGDQLHPVFINHGLLRKFEVEQVQTVFRKTLGFENFHYVDASDIFLSKLDGVEDPEEKRKIIGFTFIEVFENKAKELADKFGEIKFLGQGTIYSDRIESGAAGTGSQKIKSHHNLTLPEKMDMEVIEPLKELYKDEVRSLGVICGAPTELINRFPFPGPGLAVRILGNITRDKIKVLQDADHIFLEELKNNGFNNTIWQAFAVLLSGKAVGVQGDNRAYGNIIALRAVTSTDAMTADFAEIPFSFLRRVSTRIINEVKEVTRVVYDISTKPPSTIEFE